MAEIVAIISIPICIAVALNLAVRGGTDSRNKEIASSVTTGLLERPLGAPGKGYVAIFSLVGKRSPLCCSIG